MGTCKTITELENAAKTYSHSTSKTQCPEPWEDSKYNVAKKRDGVTKHNFTKYKHIKTNGQLLMYSPNTSRASKQMNRWKMQTLTYVPSECTSCKHVTKTRANNCTRPAPRAHCLENRIRVHEPPLHHIHKFKHLLNQYRSSKCTNTNAQIYITMLMKTVRTST